MLENGNSVSNVPIQSNASNSVIDEMMINHQSNNFYVPKCSKILLLHCNPGNYVNAQYKQRWGHVNLVRFLFKKSPLCPNDLTNYQSITSLKLLSKILEKIVVKQIQAKCSFSSFSVGIF